MDREPYNFNPRFLLTVFIFSLVVTIWILINTFFFTPYSIDQTASTGDFSMSIKVDSSIKTRKNTKVYATAKDKNSIGKQKKGSIGIALEGPVNKDFWKIDFETGIDGYVEKDHISYYSDPTRDTIPPTLLMLSPKGNISVSGTVHFKLDVSDNRGIDHVDFIIDGVTVKTLTQAPYEIYVGGSDPSAVPYPNTSKTHKFAARAVDTSGNATDVDPIVTLISPVPVREGGVTYIKFTFGIADNYTYIVEKTISLASPIAWVDVNTLPVAERGRTTDNGDGTLSYLAPAVGTMGFFRVRANDRPQLSVTIGGSGSVSSSPSGISCPSSCSLYFDQEQIVTLTAIPNPGNVFASWSWDVFGDPNCSRNITCPVNMSISKRVLANFIPTPLFSLTVTKNGQGTINSNPTGITCGSICTWSFANSLSVILTASPTTGHTFSGWGGDASSCNTNASCEINMNSIKNVIAGFTEIINPDPTQRPPWQNFDLSKWKIQVTAKQTSPTEYFPSQFDANASSFSTWFRTDPADGSMLFWLDSYKNSASGTYLRSELREVIDGSTSDTNWNPLVGTHTLRANIKVKQISGMPTQITVLQIHPYDPINPLLRVAWYLNSSNPSQSYIKAHYKTDATGDANASVTCSNPVGLNRFDAEVIVQNQQLILNINGIRCLTYPIPFWNHEGYFKAGDYAQAYSGTSQVNFYRLEATHTP